MFLRSMGSALALMAGLMLAPTAGEARDLRYATGFPPGSTGALSAEKFAAKAKETSDGELNITVYSQSLLSFSEMSDGIRDGIADMGFALGAYSPNLYPSLNLAGESTMMWNLSEFNYQGGLAWAGALIEFVMLNCPTCQEEFKAQNQVYTSTSSTEYFLMCRSPIRTLEDLQGKSIRTPGAHWARWAVAAGARSSSIPTQETFEAMTQGILDCTLGGPAELVDMSLADVVTHIIMGIPGGGFGSTAQVNVNRDLWLDMSPEERTALLKASTYVAAENSVSYRDEGKEALEMAKERGITFIEPEPALIEWTQEFTRKDIAELAGNIAEKYNLPNAESQLETLMELYQKWVALVADIQTDEELATLIWDETMSKIDVNTYGQ